MKRVDIKIFHTGLSAPFGVNARIHVSESESFGVATVWRDTYAETMALAEGLAGMFGGYLLSGSVRIRNDVPASLREPSGVSASLFIPVYRNGADTITRDQFSDPTFIVSELQAIAANALGWSVSAEIVHSDVGVIRSNDTAIDAWRELACQCSGAAE